jgi:GTP-binding protein HflX
MGEKQIEIDKRLLRDRIQFLKKKVDKVKTHRSLYRERRKETPVPVISLVGYTNAGKSSLLNVLDRRGGVRGEPACSQPWTRPPEGSHCRTARRCS